MSFLPPCPHLVHDAIWNAVTAQQCGDREQFGWTQSGCRMKLQPDAAGTACGDATHEPALLFRTFRPDRLLGIRRPALPGSDRGVCLRGSPRSVAATGRNRFASGFLPRHRSEVDFGIAIAMERSTEFLFDDLISAIATEDLIALAAAGMIAAKEENPDNQSRLPGLHIWLRG
jgi:hypothetical protein